MLVSRRRRSRCKTCVPKLECALEAVISCTLSSLLHKHWSGTQYCSDVDVLHQLVGISSASPASAPEPEGGSGWTCPQPAVHRSARPQVGKG